LLFWLQVHFLVRSKITSLQRDIDPHARVAHINVRAS